jgi:BCD family chlorophyll transporter-like MFS transporter
MSLLRQVNNNLARQWSKVGTQFLPFADAASRELPMGRLLRLSLFQVTVGMALALLNGTLNRVMIVELNVPAWLVSLMVALPLVFAPLRALMGFRSDTHRSALGWRRVPYIWMGSLLQFGGFAIMPFALLVLSGDTHGPALFGQIGAGLAFLLVGAGMHMTQTAGLALATDLAPEESRPRVVALLYVMLLLGMVVSSVVFGALLADFKQVKLIQVIQGAALITMVLNMVALWKQEARDPAKTAALRGQPRPSFSDSWRSFIRGGRASRLLVSVGLGTAAFSMQDILLEPYGGQIMNLPVGATSSLTALMAGGALAAFTLASRWLYHGGDPYRLAALGLLSGVFGFSSVIFADPMQSAMLFRIGAILIGFGGGFFSVATLTAAMGLQTDDRNGLALGAWGAVQATAGGVAIALGGGLRDVVSSLAERGALGEALMSPAVGYSVVYHLEILLLFATLVAIGPLVRSSRTPPTRPAAKFGLADMPG